MVTREPKSACIFTDIKTPTEVASFYEDVNCSDTLRVLKNWSLSNNCTSKLKVGYTFFCPVLGSGSI